MSDEQRLAEIRARAEARLREPRRGLQPMPPADSDLAAAMRSFEEWMDSRDGWAQTAALAHEDVRFLLALVADLQRVLGDLCEESDAAAEALRYRRALEEIAAGRVTVAGGAEPMLGVDAAGVAREALAGRGDAGPVVNLLGRHLPRG